MKPLFTPIFFFLLVLCTSSFLLQSPSLEKMTENEVGSGFTETDCQSYFNGEVITKTLNEGFSSIGHSIWFSRGSKRVQAKYFAHKQEGTIVDDRYKNWRQGKDIILISSGAYATGWDGKDVPAGITVDAGKMVNRNYESTMDGLVIIYKNGGIVVSNIENQDLTLSKGGRSFVLDVTSPSGRAEFLAWAQNEGVTVFQTHLVAYKNELLFRKDVSETARRKLLALTKDIDGNIYHVVFYMKNKSYTLYNASKLVLEYLTGRGYECIALANLDTGGYDIISTGSDVRDCNGDYITGTANKERPKMTNMLVYWYNKS